MLHWMVTCLRMLPEDFEIATLYGVGRNWPLRYDELQPYYELAECEIGVSADRKDQEHLGITFSHDYVYPMHKIPQSYLDQQLAARVNGMQVTLGKRPYMLCVRSTPQGRNSIPNINYRYPESSGPSAQRGYTTIGAVDNLLNPGEQGLAHDLGHRCAGNTSCTPICPIQAKYSALKTLNKADPKYLTFVHQAVVTRLNYDSTDGRIRNIEYQKYENPDSPIHTVHTATAAIYALAAHVVENSKILLASQLAMSSGLVGKCLMDHPTMITWGLMPFNIGAFRGPLCTLLRGPGAPPRPGRG